MHLLAGPLSIRKLLWMGWLFLAVFFGTLLAANFVLPKDKALGQSNIGIDFISFYRAGELIHQGKSHELYDLDATRSFDRELAKDASIDLGDGYGPFYYPPFYAWLFVPLATLSFQSAAAVAIWFGLGCFVVSAVLMCRMIKGRDWRDWALAPAILIVSMPFVQVICHGQNTFLSLLIASIVVTAWRAKRAFVAGCVAGLLLYKPQLAAVMVGVLVLNLGWRALAGAGLTATTLILVNILTLPGTLSDYLHHLTPNVAATMAFHSYVWQRHVTLKAFWQILFMGHSMKPVSSSVGILVVISCLPVAIKLLTAIWRNRRATSPDRLIAATVAAMPLLMPYYLDYDLLLLALPAVLFASEIIRARTLQRKDKWLIALWTVLFFLLMVPSLTRYLAFSLVIPCLTAIAILLLNRACETNSSEAIWSESIDDTGTGNWVCAGGVIAEIADESYD